MLQPPMENPSAVVFDLGNVVVGWDPFGPFSDWLTRAEWEEFTAAADFFELNRLADAGMPVAEVAALAGGRNSHYGDLVREYYRSFDKALTGPVPGTAAIVEELQAEGIRLLGLTNWSAETFAFAPVAAPVIKRLEAVIVSGEEGLTKPDPEIFRRLLETYALRPEATVFIDDSVSNVEAAQSLGFVALQFVGADQLRRDLNQLGLLR
ncbi:HAD family hydrolase [Arthrobacter pigmenti]